jgi:hypothetical protein
MSDLTELYTKQFNGELESILTKRGEIMKDRAENPEKWAYMDAERERIKKEYPDTYCSGHGEYRPCKTTHTGNSITHEFPS